MFHSTSVNCHGCTYFSFSDYPFLIFCCLELGNLTSLSPIILIFILAISASMLVNIHVMNKLRPFQVAQDSVVSFNLSLFPMVYDQGILSTLSSLKRFPALRTCFNFSTISEILCKKFIQFPVSFYIAVRRPLKLLQLRFPLPSTTPVVLMLQLCFDETPFMLCCFFPLFISLVASISRRHFLLRGESVGD